jgi:hypothetical protein
MIEPGFVFTARAQASAHKNQSRRPSSTPLAIGPEQVELHAASSSEAGRGESMPFGLPIAAPITPAATTTGTAWRAWSLGAGLVHDDFPILHAVPVEHLDRLLRVLRRRHLNEGKAPRLPRDLVTNDVHCFDCTSLLKQSL